MKILTRLGTSLDGYGATVGPVIDR